MFDRLSHGFIFSQVLSIKGKKWVYLVKFFSSGNKSYDKYGDVLKNINNKEQRLETIEVLEDLPAEHAVPQLLKRFEISVDSGLQDSKEKEQCMKLIVAHGDKSKTYIEAVLTKERKISWPIKLLKKFILKWNILTYC